MKKLSPEYLMQNEEFQLLAEVEHRNVKTFILEQINFDNSLIRWFSGYQIAMIAFFILLLVKAIILFNRGINDALIQIAYAAAFSFSVLIILHEMIHAIAYWLTGARKLKAGAILKKFIFYVVADRQVIDYRSFRLIAYAPFIVVKVVCFALAIYYWPSHIVYFFLSTMCIHSLFCAGDIAMLAFYKKHSDKEIYNFDDLTSGKTFFYFRKQC